MGWGEVEAFFDASEINVQRLTGGLQCLSVRGKLIELTSRGGTGSDRFGDHTITQPAKRMTHYPSNTKRQFDATRLIRLTVYVWFIFV